MAYYQTLNQTLILTLKLQPLKQNPSYLYPLLIKTLATASYLNPAHLLHRNPHQCSPLEHNHRPTACDLLIVHIRHGH